MSGNTAKEKDRDEFSGPKRKNLVILAACFSFIILHQLKHLHCMADTNGKRQEGKRSWLVFLFSWFSLRIN